MIYTVVAINFPGTVHTHKKLFVNIIKTKKNPCYYNANFKKINKHIIFSKGTFYYLHDNKVKKQQI